MEGVNKCRSREDPSLSQWERDSFHNSFTLSMSARFLRHSSEPRSPKSQEANVHESSKHNRSSPFCGSRLGDCSDAQWNAATTRRSSPWPARAEAFPSHRQHLLCGTIGEHLISDHN